MNPDRLAELEEERRFLFRSLDDLELEHDAGDIDDVDYETLKDGYITRAAAVLRAIEEGRAALPDRPPRRWGRIAAGTALVVALAAVAGWGLARDSGQRLPGETFTGGLPGDSISALLSRARALGLNDPAQAIDLYGQVLALDPDHVEALTYRSWLLALVSGGASDEVRALALEQVRTDLGRAIELDPSYPDAHCFAGIIAFRFDNDLALAKSELERCQASNPPAEVSGLVAGILQQVDAALGGSSNPDGTPPTSDD